MYCVDVRNSITPIAILQMRQEMESRPVAGLMTLICDDTSFIEDMRSIMRDFEFTIDAIKPHDDHLKIDIFYKQTQQNKRSPSCPRSI